MADNARQEVKNTFSNVPINVEVVKESPHSAVGTGSGIMWVIVIDMAK